MPDKEPIVMDDELVANMKSAGLYYSEDFQKIDLPGDILNRVPRDLATQYHLIPTGVDPDTEQLLLASDSPEAIKHISMIERRLKASVRILISTEENVKAGLARFYNITNYRAIIRTSNVGDDEGDSNLKRKVKQLLDWCIMQNASDLHLIPYSNGIFVKVRIYGFLQDVSSDWDFLPSDGPQVVNILKAMDSSGNASQQKSRIPNSGHFLTMMGDTPVECRLQTNPLGDSSDQRQHVNIRFLPQSTVTKKLENIYSGKDLQAIENVLYKGGAGMYLLSGPVGTGKSTSIQAMQEYLRKLYASFGHDINIFEIQNPIEYVDERNIQVEERIADREDLSLDAMTALRSALRSDPDIITYGEIRDSADAQVATHACQTGLRMFSTVHAGDCIRTVNRLLDLDVSRMSLLEELKLIVCQRLIGLLCPKCSRPHKLTEQERQVLTPEEIEAVETFGMRERGSVAARKACTCQDGLVGRIAIPEYVIFDNDLRNALLHMDSFDAIPKLLKEHGFKSMWEKGLDLVENGQAELSDVIQKIGRA